MEIIVCIALFLYGIAVNRFAFYQKGEKVRALLRKIRPNEDDIWHINRQVDIGIYGAATAMLSIIALLLFPVLAAVLAIPGSLEMVVCFGVLLLLPHVVACVSSVFVLLVSIRARGW